MRACGLKPDRRIEEMLRTCRWCEKLKPHYRSYRWCCIDCLKTKKPEEVKRRHRELSRIRRAEKVKTYRIKEREKYRLHRRAHNLKQYGLTPEKFDWLFAEQGSVCAACKNNDPQSHNGWHVDHDHKRNWTRAILCAPCNRTIGHAQENIQRLRACANYLEIANDPSWR